MRATFPRPHSISNPCFWSRFGNYLLPKSQLSRFVIRILLSTILNSAILSCNSALRLAQKVLVFTFVGGIHSRKVEFLDRHVAAFHRCYCEQLAKTPRFAKWLTWVMGQRDRWKLDGIQFVVLDSHVCKRKVAIVPARLTASSACRGAGFVPDVPLPCASLCRLRVAPNPYTTAPCNGLARGLVTLLSAHRASVYRRHRHRARLLH